MAKKVNVTFSVDQIMHVNVSASKSGYNYASVNVKIADNQYVTVGYEWKDVDGDNVPDFVMDLLSFVNKKDTASASVNKELASENKEFASRYEGFTRGKV